MYVAAFDRKKDRSALTAPAVFFYVPRAGPDVAAGAPVPIGGQSLTGIV
jgi:hypothetical protein